MIYSPLGSSSLLVSAIGFGCMSFGDDEQKAEMLISRALEMGINFFDTADLYNNGMNETAVGQALKGKRERVIIASKAGNQARPDGKGWDWNPTKKYLLSAIDKSLTRLQTDYIDLYQLHGGTISDPIDETIEAFEIMKQQGKIRYYGISSIRPNVIAEYIRRSSIVSVMMQYSLLDRRPEEDCLDLLKKSNIGVLCRGAVAQGLLAGKMPRPYLEHAAEAVGRAASANTSLSSAKRSQAQTAVRYVLQHPAITSAVIGIRTAEQLEDAALTLDTPPLNDAEKNVLKSSVEPRVYQDHRADR